MNPPIWTVEVPRLVWPNAQNLLTRVEVEKAMTSDHGVVVVFDRESDARAFTGLLRQEYNCLLPVMRFVDNG